MGDEESSSKPIEPEAEGSTEALAEAAGESAPPNSEEEPEPPPIEASPPPQVLQPDPTIAYDWSRPPEPGAMQPVPSRPPDVVDHLIPTKNPPALLSYYLGCFSVVPCFTPFLGPAALIYGFKGLKAARENPNLPGKGHAVTGIVVGGFMLLLLLAGIVFLAVAAALANKK